MKQITFIISCTLLSTMAMAQSITVDFENFGLEPGQFLNGENADGGFQSSVLFLPNMFQSSDFGDFWSGWSISSTQDTVTSGFMNQYSAITGSGVDGSTTYAVKFGSAINLELLEEAQGSVIEGMYITNNTYAHNSMRDGDAFAKRFGGESGNDPDFFKLTIRGYAGGVLQENSVEFFLADYRFADNSLDYIVDEWEYVDLTSLGQVDSLAFDFESSDVGDFGINTPLYFCMDNVVVSTPPTVLTDTSIEAGETLTLEAGEYILDGFVYVEEGARLFIEAGTVIKGKTVPTTGDQTSALIIAKGGQIFAEGTADEPIIFTSELDDLSTTTDLTAADNQTWGGLIVLGNAPIGEDGGTDVIEGIPSNEPRIVYGGNDPMDNSGIIKYVSVRHGGSVLGADNEINGITCGGVGAGTVIDYVEVFANKDDGIELFGGTVNVTHAVIAFVGDDSFDVDESWDGFGQFIFSIQGEGIGDHGIEYDGSEATDGQPEVTGKIYNGTFIGDPANSSSDGARFRNTAAVQVWNSIFTEVAGYAYRFDDNARFEESAVAGNIAFGFGELLRGNEPALFDVTEVEPALGGISRMPNGGLDPRPNFLSPALGSATADGNAGEGVIATNYVGAFDNETNWADGWTALATYGYFGNLREEASGADLAVAVAADKETVGIFEQVTLTVTLTNNGPEMATGVVLDAATPTGTAFTNASASTGTYRLVAGQWDAGSIATGESATLELILFTLVRNEEIEFTTAVASSDAEDFIDANNMASLTLNEGVAMATDEADLELSVKADVSRFSIFSNVTYTITLTNEGPENASGVVVSAATPTNAAPAGAVTSLGDYGLFSGEWNVGTIVAGATATLELTVFTISDDAPITFFTEVIASEVSDSDSTPSNGNGVDANEDDEATTTILPASTNNRSNINTSVGIEVESLDLYPNPTSEAVTVRMRTTTTTSTTAYVLDATGRVLTAQTVQLENGLNAFQLDVRTLAGGIYFVQVEGVEHVINFRKN